MATNDELLRQWAAQNGADYNLLAGASGGSSSSSSSSSGSGWSPPTGPSNVQSTAAPNVQAIQDDYNQQAQQILNNAVDQYNQQAQAAVNNSNQQQQDIYDNAVSQYNDQVNQVSQNTGTQLPTWSGNPPAQTTVNDPVTGNTYTSGGTTPTGAPNLNNTVVPGTGAVISPGGTVGSTGGAISITDTRPGGTGITGGTGGIQGTGTAANPLGDERVKAIKDMYDAQISAQLLRLQESGDQALSDAIGNRMGIPDAYNKQRNAASVDWERQRRNFLEGANTSGINTGTRSQAELSMMGMYQRAQNTLGAAQAKAETDADRNIADIKRNTQASINEAIAKNDYQKAAALLDEYNNVYNRYVERAETLAAFGDFTGYASLYGPDVATQMFYNWAAKDPATAYKMGAINQQQYMNLMYGNPINATGIQYSVASVPGTTGTPTASDILREQATQQRDRLINAGYDPAAVQKAWEEDMRQYNQL